MAIRSESPLAWDSRFRSLLAHYLTWEKDHRLDAYVISCSRCGQQIALCDRHQTQNDSYMESLRTHLVDRVSEHQTECRGRERSIPTHVFVKMEPSAIRPSDGVAAAAPVLHVVTRIQEMDSTKWVCQMCGRPIMELPNKIALTAATHTIEDVLASAVRKHYEVCSTLVPSKTKSRPVRVVRMGKGGK